MLHLLGPPRWQSATDQPSRRLSDVESRLLLCLARQGPMRRQALAAKLWPDTEPHRAHANLRKRVQLLRKALGAETIVGTTELALNAAVETDLARAQAAITADAQALSGELLEGVAVAGGGLDWLAAERAVWRARLAGLLQQLLTHHASDGRAAEALPYAERLVALTPEDEHAWLRLVQLHYLAGHADAALHAARRCEAALWQEDRRRAPVALHELITRIERALAEEAPGLQGVPLMRRRPPRLVGRDDELLRMDQAWQQARAVVLSGEPGMGKSRLAQAMAARHPGSLLLLARPGDAAEPYGLLDRLMQALAPRLIGQLSEPTQRELARLLPAFGEPAGGPVSTPRLHAALSDALSRAGQLGLLAVIVDDLQYADPASIEVLLQAAGGGTGLPPRWLLAVRAGEWPALLQAWLPSLSTEAAELLALEPLSAAAVAELLCEAELPAAQAARIAPGLWRHAGGNPYFVLETVHEHRVARTDARWAVSPHLRDIVVRRLQRLSPMAMQLARAAALCDRDFSVELAAELLGLKALALAPAWQELQEAQLLQGTAFAHDIAREAVLSVVPQVIASAIHRQLAAKGEAFGIPAPRRARHALAAQDDALALPPLLQAAAEAERLSRRREEADWLDEAIAILQRQGNQAALAAVLARRVLAAHHVDRHDRQLQLAEAWLAAADSAAGRCRALIALAPLRYAGPRPQEGETTAGEAVALARRLGDAALERAAARVMGEQLSLAGREAEALAMVLPWCDAAMASPRREDASLLVGLSVALTRAGRPREALPLLRHVARRARAEADWGLLAESELNTGYALNVCAQVARAAVWYRRARDTHRRTGHTYPTWSMHFIGVARLYRELGRFAEALEWLQEIRDEQRNASGYRLHTNSDGDLAFLWQQLGQPARALQALGDDEPAPGSYLPSWQLARARIEHWAGGDGVALLRACLSAVSAESRMLRWIAGRDLALALAPNEGAALASTLLAECEEVDCPLARWPMHVALADRLAAAGRTGEAADVCHRLLRGLGPQVMPSLHAPQAWWLVGRALQAAGDGEGAAQAFGRGLRWIDAAMRHVPAPFVESFRRRNPFVASLIAWRSRPG